MITGSGIATGSSTIVEVDTVVILIGISGRTQETVKNK
jgi:hypothetical protein